MLKPTCIDLRLVAKRLKTGVDVRAYSQAIASTRNSWPNGAKSYCRLSTCRLDLEYVFKLKVTSCSQLLTITSTQLRLIM